MTLADRLTYLPFHHSAAEVLAPNTVAHEKHQMDENQLAENVEILASNISFAKQIGKASKVFGYTTSAALDWKGTSDIVAGEATKPHS